MYGSTHEPWCMLFVSSLLMIFGRKSLTASELQTLQEISSQKVCDGTCQTHHSSAERCAHQLVQQPRPTHWQWMAAFSTASCIIAGNKCYIWVFLLCSSEDKVLRSQHHGTGLTKPSDGVALQPGLHWWAQPEWCREWLHSTPWNMHDHLC